MSHINTTPQNTYLSTKTYSLLSNKTQPTNQIKKNNNPCVLTHSNTHNTPRRAPPLPDDNSVAIGNWFGSISGTYCTSTIRTDRRRPRARST